MDPSTNLTENTEKVELVTYHDEGEKKQEVVELCHLEPALLNPAKDELKNSITNILERPYEATNFLWNVNDVAGLAKAAVTVPGDWLVIPNIRQKINKFKFLRADFEVRVQVNAQPMNAGRLLIVFFPNYGNQTILPSSASHLGGITGYPRVDLDVAECTSATLQIPFALNQSHFDIVRALGNLGTFGIYVYSPLTGSNDVDCTVWVTAKNVKLEMPVGINLYPLEGELQMAGIDVSPEEAEATEKKQGVVSRVAGTVKEAFDALTGIPVISTFAQAGSLVAGAVAGVAGLFGWSKPIDDSKTMLMQAEFGRHFATSEGDSKAKVLALSRTNKTAYAQHVAPCCEDEMSLSYITSKFTYLTSFPYSTTHSTNAVLTMIPVSPSSCSKQKATHGINHMNTFLSYLSAHFSAWRGGIEYKFKLVKTPFHTGRLRFIWIPGVTNGVDVTTVDINSCYSEVYDIRERTEINFTVPFVSAIPYWSCTTVDERKHEFCHSIPTGIVVVEVLNVLRATTSVASTIQILVEVRGAPDFEFAYPCLESGYSLAADSPMSNVVSSNSLYKTGMVTKLVRGKYKTENTANSANVPSMALSSVRSQESRGFAKAEAGADVGTNSTAEKPQPTRTEMVKENVKQIALKPNLNLTTREICLLPKAKGTETVPISATSRPTHQYTAQQRAKLWSQYIEKNPSMKNDEHWKLFASLHPVAECPMDQQFVGIRGPGAGVANHYTAQKIQEKMDKGELQFVGKGDNSPIPDSHTFGEMVVSLRQILKRTQIYLKLATANVRLQPYVTQSIGAAEGEEWRTFFDRFAALYRWQSGGLHLTLMPTTGFDLIREVSLTPSWQEETVEQQTRQTALTTVVHQGQPVVPAVTRFEGITEFLVPFYQPFSALLTSVGAPVYQNNTVKNDAHAVLHNNGTCVDITNATGVRVGRHIAEDFSFHYLIGPPLLSRAE